MKHTFAISPLLQSHLLEFANEQPFDRAMALLQTALPAAEVGSSQSQRLTRHFGNLPDVEEILSSPGFDFDEPATEQQQSEKILYVQVDGGHLRTDEGFRETKVGRVFGGHQLTKISSDNQDVKRRMELASSDYLAHLGNHFEFTCRFDSLVRAHLRHAPDVQMVAISDGAEWIANWLLTEYPAAIVILDFYHALEHLADFATSVFSSQTNRSDWIEECKKELLDGQLDLRVSRRRFVPVKKNNDLLLLRSDVYRLNEQYELEQMVDELPLIDLDMRYYQLLNELETRFPHGAPSLKMCRRLEITGDVYFGRNVAVKGDAKIMNDDQEPLYIGDQTIVNGVIDY